MEMLVERLIQFGYFTGQAVIIVAALLILLSFIFSLTQKSKDKPEIEIEDLGQKFKDYEKTIKYSGLDKKELKTERKKEKKDKKDQKSSSKKPTTYVLDFEGDMKASATDKLRTEISAILNSLKKDDEVVLRLESPGGVVHGYGLAAAQLLRIKKTGAKLTVCVDKVAASGGYLMSCVADQILAAPFAIVGSIGVIAQVPNFHKLLKKHDVEYKEVTSGEFKRTVSLLGEITPQGEQKFQEQIVETHGLFKNFVKENRPIVDLEKVATGEYWFGKQAIDLKLIDSISTSDEYLMDQSQSREVKSVKFEEKKKMAEKLGLVLSNSLTRSLTRFFQDLEARRYF